MDCPPRRWVHAVAGAALGGVAGCAGMDSPDGGSTPAEATPTDGGELDLGEANVVDVAVSPQGDGSVDFDVTLHHDDEGEDGYANWWQVETLAGERLGRRDLLHAHTQQPFTRSTTVEVPAEVDCVVVRGHDETHGYGGQAMVVSIESGATRIVKQGSSKESLSSVDCSGAE